MTTTEILLIDLSALAHAIWHVSGSEPDPSYVSNQIIARVRALASNHPHAAICCDSGKSFRADIDPTYKANRDVENRAPLRHQMTVACETLRKDGFVVWAAAGYEADDIIATATRETLAIDGEATVLIASEDKDLLQLVNDRVSAKNLRTGNIVTPADVVAKFGVRSDQMLDYLCIVGDASDNVPGVDGIGAVGAAELLKAHGTLANIYAAMDKGVVAGITPAKRTKLMAFRERWPIVKQLIALRDDVPIPFVEIAAERTAAAMTEEAPMDTPENEPTPAATAPAAPTSASGTTAGASPSEPNGGNSAATPAAPPPQPSTLPVKAAAPSTDLVSAPPPVEWELQLEPRSYRDVRVFSDDMHLSRKFMRNFGSAHAIAAAVVSGRELGVPAMASLRGFHSVEDGPPMPNADLVRALVLKSGKVEYFDPIERSDKAAEFAIKRHGRPEIRLRYTVEEGRTAYGFDVPMTDKERADLEKKWQKSGWGKNPADMLVARSSMKLGRLVCPDVCAGLYAPEEFDVK